MVHRRTPVYGGHLTARKGNHPQLYAEGVGSNAVQDGQGSFAFPAPKRAPDRRRLVRTGTISNTHADWVWALRIPGGNTPPICAPQETAVPRSCPSIPCLTCLANSTLMLPSPFRLLADLPTTVPRMRRTQSGCSGLKQAETSPTSSRFRCGFSCLPPRNTLQALLCDAAPLASRLIRGRTGQCERSNGAPIPANVLECSGGMMLCPP